MSAQGRKIVGEAGWTRSTREEVIGTAWAIFACLSPHWTISAFAWAMAGVSWLGAVVFAVQSLRSPGSSEGE